MELKNIGERLNFTDEQKVLFVQSILEAGKSKDKTIIENFLYENTPASIEDSLYKELVKKVSEKAVNNEFGLLEEKDFNTDIKGSEVSFDKVGDLLNDISLEVEKMSDSEKKVFKNNKELEAKLSKLTKDLGLKFQKEEKENSCPKCGGEIVNSSGKEKCSECGYVKTQKDVGEAIDRKKISKRDISTSGGGGDPATGDGGAEQVKIIKGPKKGQYGLVASDLRIDGKVAVEVQGEIVVLDFGDVEAMGSKYEHIEGDKKEMVKEQDYVAQVKKLEDSELLKLAKRYDDPAMKDGGNIPIDIVKDELKSRGLKMKEEKELKLTKSFAEGYVAGHSDFANKEVKESLEEKDEDFIKGYEKAISENKEKELEERKKLEESISLVDILEEIKKLSEEVKKLKEEDKEKKEFPPKKKDDEEEDEEDKEKEDEGKEDEEKKKMKKEDIDVDSVVEKYHNGEMSKEDFMNWYNTTISQTEEEERENVSNYIVEKTNDTEKEDLKINLISEEEVVVEDEIDSESIISEAIKELVETDKERVKELVEKLEYKTEEELKEQVSEIIKELSEEINNTDDKEEKQLSSSENLMQSLGLLR
jgi:ribosomal protein L37E